MLEVEMEGTEKKHFSESDGVEYNSKSVMDKGGRHKWGFGELWRSRELVWILFQRDIKSQYRESYLGYLWLFAAPLFTSLVWVFLNGQKIVVVKTELPYPVFVILGTTLWTSFSAAVSSPMQSFEAGKPVFMKLKVPVEAFLLSGFLRTLFDLLLRLTILVPIFLLYEITPSFTVILFPFASMVLLLSGFSIGLVVTPIASLYGDVSKAVGAFLGLFMYLTPVVYSIPGSDTLLAKAMSANPLTPLFKLCRDVLTTGDLSSLPFTVLWFVIILLIGIMGLGLLKISMPHLVARMGM